MSDDRPAAQPADRAAALRSRSSPATFREVFAVREFRALYFALRAVNWVGDYLARAAVTALVYQQTESVLLSAAAVRDQLPAVVSAARCWPRSPSGTRTARVMIVCDLARMVLIALVALPGLPVPVDARAALPGRAGRPARPGGPLGAAAADPRPATGCVVGLALQHHAPAQAAQVVGYLAGAALAAAINPRLALLLDAVTFAVSALLIALGVTRRRPAAGQRRAPRTCCGRPARASGWSSAPRCCARSRCWSSR